MEAILVLTGKIMCYTILLQLKICQPCRRRKAYEVSEQEEWKDW